jgi:hypothetical protein
LKCFKGLLLPSLFLLFAVTSQASHAQAADDESSLRVETAPVDYSVYNVTIVDPFIEIHTGPSAGYPVFYVIDRGEKVRVILRKTNWFKIESSDGKIGWASRDQMRETLLPSGEKFKIIELDEDDFSKRRWVLGVTGGEFESAPVFTVFTGYSFTENLAIEGHFGKSVGDNSSAEYIKANMVMQPLPHLKYSPYMTLGLGKIEVSPSATLIVPEDDSNSFAQFGIGVQRYVGRSFLFRFEANEYVIFSTSNTSDNNEVVSEWKFGFAVFF